MSAHAWSTLIQLKLQLCRRWHGCSSVAVFFWLPYQLFGARHTTTCTVSVYLQYFSHLHMWSECVYNTIVQFHWRYNHEFVHRFNLEYVTEGDCQGPLPTVEFSLRSSIDGDTNIPQEFAQWKLIQYYTGEYKDQEFVLFIHYCVD